MFTNSLIILYQDISNNWEIYLGKKFSKEVGSVG